MAGRHQLEFKDSDKELVRRFVRQHEGEAFSLLMGRYADMVYATSWRILGDQALAADAVQETFFQLVKDAHKITGSIGGWLHRVATRRAVDLVRQNVSRRNREQSYALEADCRSNTWSEVEPAVDEALEELPEDLREVLLLHFLQGRSTIQIAADQGISQPTISRRIAEALELLRQKLRRRGIAAAAVPLQAVLQHSNQIAPEAVRVGLGKIALAKAAGVSALWTFGNSVPIAAKLALATTCAVLMAGAIWVKAVQAKKAKVAAVHVSHAEPPVPSVPKSVSAQNIETAVSDVPVIMPPRLPVVQPIETVLRTRPASKSDVPAANPLVSAGALPNPNRPSQNNLQRLIAATTAIQSWPQALPSFSNDFIDRDIVLKGRLYQAAATNLDNHYRRTNHIPDMRIPNSSPGGGAGAKVTPPRNPGPVHGAPGRRTLRVNGQ